MAIKMKVYRRGSETLVAACDEGLLGKTFRQGELRLEVSGFYDGDVVTEEKFLTQLAGATMGNFVGQETIETAKRGGYVADDGVLWIDGVPHAQYFVMT